MTLPLRADDARRSLRDAIEASILEHAQMDELASATPEGYLRMVATCAAASEICERLQREAVQQARQADHSWATIGKLMGITRQAAQQRFATAQPAHGATDRTKVLASSVANEMQLLKREGRDGFHLVDFGLHYVQLEASDQVWEHRREVALNIRSKRAALEADGWIYVGAWLPFHYFKRATGELV